MGYFVGILLSVLVGFPAWAQPTLPSMSMAPGVIFTFQQLPERVIQCSQHTDNSLKIRCYDDLAELVRERTRVLSMQNRFAWTNKIIGNSDPKTLTVAIASIEGIVDADSTTYKNNFFLTMTCKAGITNAYIAFPLKISETSVNAKMRLGGNERSLRLFPSVSGAAMGIWGSESKNLINALLNQDNVEFEFKFQEKHILVVFDIRGIDMAVQPISSTCKNG